MVQLSQSTMIACLLHAAYLLSHATVALTTGSLYFPISYIEVTIPANLWSLPDPVPVLQLTAVLEKFSNSDNTEPRISYHIVKKPTPPKWIRINKTTGEVFILPSLQSTTTNEVTLVIQARAEKSNIAAAEMSMTLWRSNVTVGCHEITKRHCFWKHSKYQLFENQPSLELGALAPSFIYLLCPDLHFDYIVNEGHEINVSISQSTRGPWKALQINGPQDREANYSEHRMVHVTCLHRNSRKFNSSINIEILDQNDNAPTAQSQEIHVATNSTELKSHVPDTGGLVFLDLDSGATNNFVPQIIDDLGLLSTSCFTWNISMPFAKTVIHCNIMFLDDVTLPYSYKAIVTLDDTNLVPDVAKKFIKPQITLILGPKNKKPEVGNITFPTTDIRISRNAALYERITEPLNKVHEDSLLIFRLQQAHNVFDITRRTGIIYIANTTELQSSTWNETELKVRLKTENTTTYNLSTILRVKIAHEKVSCMLDARKEGIICARFENSSTCTRKCGYSSSSFCQWRNLTQDNNITNCTKHYATCSPNIKTCPDGVCDELEMIHPNICPQDCTYKLMGAGQQGTSARGIKCSAGTCTCSNSQRHCMCWTNRSNENLPYRKPSSRSSSLVVPRPTVEAVMAQAAICGDRCLLAIILGPLFFFSSVVVLTIWLRRRKMLVAVRSKRRFTAQASTGRIIIHHEGEVSTAGDSNAQDMNEVLAESDSHANKLQTNLIAKLQPDNKWEIPRERLRIEQVLGEGEFGRVLKASAKDLPNIPGRTTVAVKMLKEDAGNSELVDLLSEYELLKEVSHPNVIRLLGACTSPGGPVYIIIEFAEHGSLRGYLRRSRHLQCSTSGVAELENTPPPNPIAPITPRDILSFAWQISRGMSYLSDMKLVHRDLAARNVLVASGFVCKVSDFGLTRDVYEDDTYLKRSKGRVPVKWMAIESLADNIYTSKSDVWSFGIVLWELLSLGSSPYPGVAVQNLYQLIRTGYRMERPDNCSQQLYHLMRICWDENPALRPTFKEISLQLEGMLQDGADYLDLNSLIINNRGYMSEPCTVPLLQDSSTSSSYDDTDEGSRTRNSNSETSNEKYATIDTQLLAPVERSSDGDQAGPASLSSRHSEADAKYESPIISGPKLAGIPLQYLEVEDVSYKKSA